MLYQQLQMIYLFLVALDFLPNVYMMMMMISSICHIIVLTLIYHCAKAQLKHIY